jgi:hypothetical protein
LIGKVQQGAGDRDRYLKHARGLYGSVYGRECRRFMCYYPELI